jgi:hypothetical protein
MRQRDRTRRPASAESDVVRLEPFDPMELDLTLLREPKQAGDADVR